jgi:sugar lactone lactonase YvrE
MTKFGELEIVPEARALNGERPVWDETRHRLFWIDVREPALHGFDPESQRVSGDTPAWILVDRDDFYWCAVFGQAFLMRLDPSGRLERRVQMPVQYPTMTAFGGAEHWSIYVTSACWPFPATERPRRPNEGTLFALEAPIPGQPPCKFTTHTEAIEATP